MREEPFRSRYPNYNVLDKWSSPDWDDQTRDVVRQRLEEIPPIRFFTDEEARLLAAIAELIVPQPERTSTGVNPSLTIEAIAARTANRICRGIQCAKQDSRRGRNMKNRRQ